MTSNTIFTKNYVVVYSEPKRKLRRTTMYRNTKLEKQETEKDKREGKEQGSSCSSSRLGDHYIEVISGW